MVELEHKYYYVSIVHLVLMIVIGAAQVWAAVRPAAPCPLTTTVRAQARLINDLFVTMLLFA